MIRFGVKSSIALTVGMLLASVTSQAGVDDFTLTRVIPADAALVAHSRQHSGKDFLNRQYEQIWTAIQRANFDRDVKRMIEQALDAQNADTTEFQQNWDAIIEMVSGVDWDALFEKEDALAIKFAFPVPEVVILGKATEQKAAGNFEKLSAMLKKGANSLGNDLTLTTEGAGSSVTHRVTFKDVPLPLGAVLARRGDVILFGVGGPFVEQSLQLLEGGEGQRLADTERFRTAIQPMPEPRDGFEYIDFQRMLPQIKSLLGSYLEMSGQAMGEQEQQIMKLPGKLLDGLKPLDYSITVSSTDGMRTVTDNVTALRDGARDSALYRIAFGNGPINEPLKYVPENATDVSITSGVDLLAGYNQAVTFVRTEVPDGEQGLQQWESMQQDMDFNVRDYLAWIHGGLANFSVAGPDSFAPTETVVMVRVKDEKAARKALDDLRNFVEPRLDQGQGQFREVGADQLRGRSGFYKFEQPALMMFLGAPTFGVADGWIFIGTSPKILRKSFAVADGEASNLSQNKRFQEEGLRVANNVTSFSFMDLERVGEEIGQALQMIPLLGQFNAEIMKDPNARAMFSMLSKFGRVAREFDFLLSTCSQSTFDGKALSTQTVWTYRDPEKKEEGAGDNQSDGN